MDGVRRREKEMEKKAPYTTDDGHINTYPLLLLANNKN